MDVNFNTVSSLAAVAREGISSGKSFLQCSLPPALKSDVLSLSSSQTPRKGFFARFFPQIISDKNAVKIKKGKDSSGRCVEREFTGKVKTRETFFNAKGDPTTTYTYHSETGRKIGKIIHDNGDGQMVTEVYHPETGKTIDLKSRSIRKRQLPSISVN